METPRTHHELQTAITQEHDRIQAALARADRSSFDQPGAEGDWRVQDVLAHITAWEQMMLGWLQTLAASGVPDRYSPGQFGTSIDQINADIFARQRHAALADVLAAFETSFAAVMQAVSEAPAALLFQPDYSAWNNGVPFAALVAANTYEHYADHVQALEHWADLHPQQVGA